MMKRKTRRTLLVVGIIVTMLALAALLSYMLISVAERIGEVGLKTIVEQIWEGSEK